jgi:TPP-dependent pyruvate/acetoin dehydrogenase alpha subunit
LEEILTKKDELIRFESFVAEEFNSGKIRAPIHLSDGNEDQLIEIFERIRSQDWVFCSWRSHYQCLLKGVPADLLLNEIMAGNSISLSFPDYRVYSSAIVGGVVPIATGVAFQIKHEKRDEHVWCFLGDMTSETGIAHESIKYASAFDLPITFVIEDNNLSVVSNTRSTWGVEKLSYEEPSSNPKVIRYQYNSRYPHAGAGKRINF